jgi:hypothetical protein
MTDHITVHPEHRFTGSLEGVPRTYRHGKCNEATTMPAEIIRSYLTDPTLYSDFTFCCGCNDYVHQSEVAWVETGQSLDDYFEQLKREHDKRAPGSAPSP